MLGRLGQLPDALKVVILDVRRKLQQRREAAKPANSAAVIRAGSSNSARGFPRVSAMILSATRLSSLPGHDTRQQRAGILFGQPIEVDVGQPIEVVPLSRLTHRDHDRHRLGAHASRDEADDLCRGGIQPLRVLDEAKHRTLLRDGGQQAEHGQSDEEPFRHLAGRRVRARVVSACLCGAGSASIRSGIAVHS